MQIDNLSVVPDFDIILEDVIVNKENSNEDVITNSNDEPVDENEPNDSNKETNKETNYSETADNTAIVFYEELKNRGYVSEEFDGTWESLDTIFDELPNKILQSLIEQSPDITKQVIRFAFSSKDITSEDLVNFVKVYTDELNEASVEIDTMDEARSFLEKIYEERGLSKKAINIALDSLEDDDELLDEAKRIKEQIDSESKHKKTEKLITEKEQESLRKKQELLDYSNKVIQEIESTGWKPTRVSKIKEVLSGNELSNKLNDIIKNPKALVKLADFITYYNNGDINYETFIKQAESPSTKDLKTRLENVFNSSGTQTKSSYSKNNAPEINNEIPIV